MPDLTLDHVMKRFGGVTAVDGLSIRVSSGRITGLIGPNGAGKTTVVNLITGIDEPTDGQIHLAAQDITGRSPETIARLGVGRTFQNIRLLREASVLENVVIGFHRHEKTSLFANLFGLPAAWRERRDFIDRGRQLLDRFTMTGFSDTRAGALSYGHQRRVEIMRALAMEPEFLLLDEPVAGMSAVEASELGVIFESLAGQGIGILLIEHNVAFVTEICDYVYVIDAGRLIAQGQPEVVCRDPVVISAYLGD
ncbi:MAG: ABC transporter ATP-binding protein [Xanthobacteraceae bacterium]